MLGFDGADRLTQGDMCGDRLGQIAGEVVIEAFALETGKAEFDHRQPQRRNHKQLGKHHQAGDFKQQLFTA